MFGIDYKKAPDSILRDKRKNSWEGLGHGCMNSSRLIDYVFLFYTCDLSMFVYLCFGGENLPHYLIRMD